MKKVEISTKNASSVNNGIFEGWGTSLCWWANRLGFSEKLTQKSARLFFSEEGLSLNIMRYNIGGGDDPHHNHITRTDSEMPGWWKYDEAIKKFRFNSDTDKNQLNVLKAAYEAAGENAYVEAFSNSPPYFMTRTGCSSGSKNGKGDNIKLSSIHLFANYLTDVCKYIQNNLGITIKSLAPMNEPFSDYWKLNSGKQEGCPVSPGFMQSNVIKATADEIKKKKLNNIILTASDDTNTERQFISALLMSRSAMREIGRLSTHTYAKATRSISFLAKKLGKNLWMSESDWSGCSGKNNGEMGPALWLAEKIIEDINTLSPSAWVIWQIVAAYISEYPDEKGRYDMPKLPDLTQGFWGTAFADIDKEEIYLTQKYHAFGQFTKYIKPSMTIIHTDNSYSIAAYDKEKGNFIIVAVNSSDKEDKVSFSFTDTTITGKTVSLIRTSGSINDGEHWSNVGTYTSQSNSIEISLKENSITTITIG